MAGYQTFVSVPDRYEDLSRVLLSAAQRRGRALELRVRFARSSSEEGWTRWSLAVHGRGHLIAAWVSQIERELPVVAEGFTGLGRGRVAVRVARSLVARFVEWCVGPDEPEPRERVILSRNDEAIVWWPCLDPPDLPHDLARRLALADGLLARWLVGDVPPEVAVDEAQTALEIVLRRLLQAGAALPFPKLTDQAFARQLFSEEERNRIVDLNNRRRSIKHHGGVIPDEEREVVREDLLVAMSALDRLESRLDVAGAEEPEGL